jgi:RNA polymerase sigma-70 factor (ECF subfamily)
MLNTRRSIARRSAAVHRLAEEMRVVDVAPEFEETAVELRVAITALSDEDAELVRLIYWDGLRSHEAATVLNLNASTVRSRLARVKKELRLALSEHHEPAPDERRRDRSSG